MMYFELPDLFWSHRVFPALVVFALVAGAICSTWYKLREGDAVKKAHEEGRRAAEADQRLKEKVMADLRRELAPQVRDELKAESQAPSARPSGPAAPTPVPHATTVPAATIVAEEPARPALPPRTRERIAAPVAEVATPVAPVPSTPLVQPVDPVEEASVEAPEVPPTVLSSPEEAQDEGTFRGADPDQA